MTYTSLSIHKKINAIKTEIYHKGTIEYRGYHLFEVWRYFREGPRKEYLYSDWQIEKDEDAFLEHEKTVDEVKAIIDEELNEAS